jgi:thiol:disulfide interchange protein
MDLKNDLFFITRKGQGPTISEMIQAVNKSGFGAVEVKNTGQVRTTPTKAKRPMPEIIRNAIEQAKREEKLVLVDFYAVWCGPCVKMLNETFPAPELRKEMNGFVFVKVDTDKLPDVSRWFGVEGIPDARILSTTGKELRRIVGFKSAFKFESILKEVQRNSRK